VGFEADENSGGVKAIVLSEGLFTLRDTTVAFCERAFVSFIPFAAGGLDHGTARHCVCTALFAPRFVRCPVLTG
jgi:hypothetical protein